MNRKKKSKDRGVLYPIKASVVWMPILTVALSLLGGFMVWKEWVSEDKIGLLAPIFAALVSFVGAWLTLRRCSNRRLLWALGSGGVYGCMLMLSNLLFFGVVYQGVGAVWGAVLSSAALAVLSPEKKKGKIA